MASFPNNTTTENGGPLYYREPESIKVLKLCAEALLALFGIFGNLCVCVVISRQNHMKTAMNLYIRSLAVADLGVLIFCFPLALIKQELVEWPLGKFFCKYIYPFSDIFFGGSIWSITVIAVERYRNIVAQERIRHQNSKKMVHIVIAVIWIASFVTQCLPLYFYMDYNDASRACFLRFPSETGSAVEQVYNLMFLVFLYIIPLTLICWTYIQVSRRIGRSTTFNRKLRDEELETKRPREREQHRQKGHRKGLMKLFKKGTKSDTKDARRYDSLRIEEKRRLKQNNKARRILTPLVVIFAFTMLPFHAGRILSMYFLDFVKMKYFWLYFSICALLIVVNSSMDPLIYALVSKDFRKAFRRMFARRRQEQYRHNHTAHLESAVCDNTRNSGKEISKNKRKACKLPNSPTRTTVY